VTVAGLKDTGYGIAIPVSITRYPFEKLKTRLARSPVAPDRGNLGDAKAGQIGFDHDFHADLKASGTLDFHRGQDIARVHFEAVGQVVYRKAKKMV
jgi:hypothetical protein